MKTRLVHTGISLLLIMLCGAVNDSAFAGPVAVENALPAAACNSRLLHRQSVGVLLSEATMANIEYLNHYREFAEHNNAMAQLEPPVRQAFVASAQPLLAVQGVATVLKRQFASVTLYDNLDALIAARPDVVVYIDARSRLISRQNSAVSVDIQAQFFTADFAYLGQARGVAGKDLASVWNLSTSVEQVAQEVGSQQAVQVDALKRFDDSVGALVGAHS